MGQIAFFVSVILYRSVYAHLYRRIKFLQELCVSGVFRHFQRLDDQTWSSVSRVVKDAFQVRSVRDSSVSFRSRVCVLKLDEVFQYLLCDVELTCYQACSREGNEHVASPVFVEPRKPCIDSVTLLLCDQLVHGDCDPVEGLVQFRQVGLCRVVLCDERIDSLLPFFGDSVQLRFVRMEFFINIHAFFFCSIDEQVSLAPV